MIGLLEHYFIVLIQCVGAIYFGLGIVLLFGKVPLAAEYLPYRKAKRCLATTYFIMGLNLFVYLAIYTSDDWKELNPYIKCSDFIFFCLEAIFFFSTFFYLLDEKYMSWRNFSKDWIVLLTSVALMITSTIGVFGKAGAWVSWFPFFIFFVQYVLFLRRFYILYNEKRSKLVNYFAEDMQQFMFWIKKSVILIILISVLCFTTLLGGIIYNYLFQVYVVSANFYIAISFINYASMYGKLNSAEVTDRERMETDAEKLKSSKTDNYEQLFGEQVKRWISEKRFLAPQLTIDDLAAEMVPTSYICLAISTVNTVPTSVPGLRSCVWKRQKAICVRIRMSNRKRWLSIPVSPRPLISQGCSRALRAKRQQPGVRNKMFKRLSLSPW